MNNNFKSFFIKLISIVFAIIIVLNVSYNLFIHDRLKKLDKILLMSKDDFQGKIRKEINNAINKENLIPNKDKKLLLKFYQKLQSEFSNIEN